MSHTMMAFDRDMDLTKQEIAKMGASALEMTSAVIDLLSSGTTEAAHEIILRDRHLDDLQRSIEEKAIVTIARRQTEACDLRHLVAAIRIAGYLERVGDYAKNIAKRALKMAQLRPAPRALALIPPLGEAACRELRAVLDAYEADDPIRAEAVWRADAELDFLEEAAFRHVLTFMMEDPRTISFCSQALFCYKNLERIGDYATNIAESVVYESTGRILADRPKGPPGGEAPDWGK